MFGNLNLFTRVIKDEDINRVLGVRPQRERSLMTKVATRCLWFWPRIEEARGWVVSTRGSRWDPYDYLHSHETKLMKQILKHTQKSDVLMELGCNCGSDRAQLFARSYTHLRGVDASTEALQIFASEYPDVFRAADVEHDLFQRYLLRQSSNSVDYIYSNGATIELVHPSFPVVAQMCRVARKGILLDLSETQQGHPRDYTGQMLRSGFSLSYSDKQDRPSDKSHIFVFHSKPASR